VEDAALLLGGYGTDRRRLHPLRDELEDRGVQSVVWPYQPVGSIAHLAEQLVARAARFDAARVHLVGHSLGGGRLRRRSAAARRHGRLRHDHQHPLAGDVGVVHRLGRHRRGVAVAIRGAA
jgi:hypothetical protein